MTEHEHIILKAAISILDAQNEPLMDAGSYYAAVSVSHAAYEVRHALRRVEEAERESTAAAEPQSLRVQP